MPKQLPSNQVERFIQALYSPHAHHRAAAITMLGKLGDERALLPLLDTFHDPARADPTDSDGDGGGRELGALIRITRRLGSSAFAILAPHIQRYGVIYVLAQSDPVATMPLLIDLLATVPITFSHVTALHTLGEIGDPEVLASLERFLHPIYQPARTEKEWFQNMELTRIAREAIEKIQQRHRQGSVNESGPLLHGNESRHT